MLPGQLAAVRSKKLRRPVFSTGTRLPVWARARHCRRLAEEVEERLPEDGGAAWEGGLVGVLGLVESDEGFG